MGLNLKRRISLSTGFQKAEFHHEAEKLHPRSNLQIYLISCVHPAGQQAVLHGKIFHVGHYMHTLQPHLFIPIMLVTVVPLTSTTVCLIQ